MQCLKSITQVKIQWWKWPYVWASPWCVNTFTVNPLLISPTRKQILCFSEVAFGIPLWGTTSLQPLSYQSEKWLDSQPHSKCTPYHQKKPYSHLSSAHHTLGCGYTVKYHMEAAILSTQWMVVQQNAMQQHDSSLSVHVDACWKIRILLQNPHVNLHLPWPCPLNMSWCHLHIQGA